MSAPTTEYRATIAATIVALFTVALGIIVALIFVDAEAAKIAAMAVITGMIGPTIVALLALLKGEQTAKQTNGINSRVATLEEHTGVDPFAGRGQRKGD